MNDNKTIVYQNVGKAYTLYRQDAFAIFRQTCIPVHICEDLVQEVFMKLLTLDFIDTGKIQSLVAVTAFHIRTDYMRHRSLYYNKVRKEITKNTAYGYYDNTVEYHELESLERTSCQRLPPKDRKVYELHRYDNKDTREIALIMNITNRAAECRLFRARKIVREEVRQKISI